MDGLLPDNPGLYSPPKTAVLFVGVFGQSHWPAHRSLVNLDPVGQHHPQEEGCCLCEMEVLSVL